MAKIIAKQWNHNRHALVKLKNLRQTGLSALRNRIYQIRGNALADGGQPRPGLDPVSA